MLMRHIRYFIAVAEELSFTRAAERLHIEQSPLSRSIRQLEDDLGVRLFERNSHGTRLTWAGQVFLEEARRVLAAAEQARAGARAAATGYRGLLRIALSDGISPSHLSNLLARCREESPEVEISLFEVTLAQQLKGLREGDYDAGFAKAEHPGEGLLATPAWSEPLVVAVPARHPALIHPELSLMELLSHPLVLCDPDACAGCSRQLDRLLRGAECEVRIAERVASHDLLMALVAAGYGLGITTRTHLSLWRHPDVVSRPLAGEVPPLTTYLLRRDAEDSEQLRSFVERLHGATMPEPDKV
ncbi:LysR family transcriptional regulator [Stenotrophomonas sp. PSU-St22]